MFELQIETVIQSGKRKRIEWIVREKVIHNFWVVFDKFGHLMEAGRPELRASHREQSGNTSACDESAIDTKLIHARLQC